MYGQKKNKIRPASTRAIVTILCLFICRSLQNNDHILPILESLNYHSQVSLSNFDAVLHIFFRISLTVIGKTE